MVNRLFRLFEFDGERAPTVNGPNSHECGVQHPSRRSPDNAARRYTQDALPARRRIGPAPARLILPAVLAAALALADPIGCAEGQEPGPAAAAALAEQKADAVLNRPDDDDKTAWSATDQPEIDLLDLLIRGGWSMVPIAFLSVVVVAVAVERWLALRRSRILSPRLVRSLDELARQPGGFDPRRASQLCRDFPSSAARVIQTMLAKIGRPHAEVERAVADACDREAARLYANVRTLNLAAAIGPLLGLLGTVWGMIKAFMATASMPVGANKAEHLAEGIYTALVTTFAGLAVAIPAAVLAHLFESRIQTRLREIDELLLDLLPRVERFEGEGGRPPVAASEPPAAAADPLAAVGDQETYNE